MVTQRTNAERGGVMVSQRWAAVRGTWEPAPLGVRTPKQAGKWFFSGNREGKTNF